LPLTISAIRRSLEEGRGLLKARAGFSMGKQQLGYYRGVTGNKKYFQFALNYFRNPKITCEVREVCQRFVKARTRSMRYGTKEQRTKNKAKKHKETIYLYQTRY
jgi:hypothetical protein